MLTCNLTELCAVNSLNSIKNAFVDGLTDQLSTTVSKSVREDRLTAAVNYLGAWARLKPTKVLSPLFHGLRQFIHSYLSEASIALIRGFSIWHPLVKRTFSLHLFGIC